MSLGKLKSNNRIEKPSSVDSTSSVSGDNSPSATSYPSVRRRISKACNYCRQRKIKCNGNSPCLNCKNHQIECTYSKTIRKKKKQTTKKLTLQDLEKRMNKMDTKFDFLNEKLTSILSILAENKLNKQSSVDEKKQYMPSKVDEQQQESSINLMSSDEESESDQEDDLEDEESIEGADFDDQQNYLSPLSNLSNGESISSSSSSSHDEPQDINYNYVDSHINGLNNFTSSQLVDVNLIPLSGSSGNNYSIDSVQFDQGITGTTNGNQTSFDFGGLLGDGGVNNKLNYLYSEAPLIGSQLDQSDVFN